METDSLDGITCIYEFSIKMNLWVIQIKFNFKWLAFLIVNAAIF